MEKVMFFVEGSYFYMGCKANGLNGWDATHIDLFGFCESFIDVAKHQLVRVYYYDAPLKKEWDEARYKMQQQYFERLKRQDYIELRLGRLQGVYPGGIVSADGDYVPAVQMCKDLGKRVWNVHFTNRASYHLMDVCDRAVPFGGGHVKLHQLPAK